MEAVLIDLSNYDSALVQSTDTRAGTPDGNVYFNKSTGLLEFITKQEIASIDLSGGITTGAIQINVVAAAGTYTRLSGSFIDDGFVAGRSFAFSGFTEGGNNVTKVASIVTALVITVTDITGLVDETGGGDEVAASIAEDNPLDETLGIKQEGVYAFENQERRVDEDLRKYDRWTDGSFKFAGAYNFINSKKPSTAADRAILRGSGWNEYALDGGVDRIYFGNKGLSQIFSGSQPYYQLVLGGAPVDFAKLGQIDEAVQVYGDTGNTPSDAGAGDFDSTTYEAVSIRTFQNNYDRKETTTDLGISELGGYSTGFALNESAHLTTGDYTLADVYGGAMISPWGLVAVPYMELEKLAAPLNVDEFAEAAGDFTWVLNNPGSGTNASPIASGNLYEMVAFLDALAQTDDDIDSGGETVTNGKRVGTWYYYNATGQIVTRSGADTLGLYLYNVPVADQQLVVFTDDAGDIKSYSFQVSVESEIGANAKADSLAWYHSFFAAAYNTSGAITVVDSGAADVKGLASSADGNNKIIFAFDYTGDTIGGPADTDKNCVFLCEGDGGVAQAKTLYTITKITTVAFACIPPVENNV